MSSIGSIGTNGSMTMQGMRPMKRPDPAEMAENLFSKLDTAGQGYIQKSDLQTAFDNISSTSSAGATASADELFSQLDADSNGKVTKQEFSDTLKKVSEQLENQAMSMRMNGGMQGMGGMPPPPPPPEGDSGFTKDELTSQLEEIGATDSDRSSLISTVVQNFDAADSDDDGKVSFKEAMAYRQSTASAGASGAESPATASEGSASTDAASESTNAKLMLQIVRLMQAYGLGGDQNSAAGTSISVSA